MKTNYRPKNANGVASENVAGNGVLVGPDGSGFAVPDCCAAVAAQDMTGSVPTPIISEADAQAYAALSGVPVADVNRNVGTPRSKQSGANSIND
ncbi:MAG: hypothetical protein LBN00_06665 [Oscillospiraceae bacterium]|jgi:hypothetical protein|nr:hypothetical protein [Oscillospiraceae bacterium]